MNTKIKLLVLFALLITLLAACSGGTGNEELTPEEVQGGRLFNIHCAACHVVKGTDVVVGPSLAGIAVIGAERVDGMDARAYIIESIVDPGAYIVDDFSDLMVKNFDQQLSEEEFNYLIDYLMTLDELPEE